VVDAQVHAVRYAAIQIARGYARRPRGDPSGRRWADDAAARWLAGWRRAGWLGLVGWLSALGSMRRGVERLHALAFPRFTTSDISIHVHEFTRADYHFIALFTV